MSISPKISVIITVYNAQEYLAPTINSILNQKFKDLEIILVDDGSTDRSPEIINNYKEKDKRIITIHQENGGVASARQKGLSLATGKYIIHADSDDVVLPGAYKRMYDLAEGEKADIVIGNYLKGEELENSLVTHQNFSIGSDVIEEILQGKFHAALWNKLIRKEMYEGIEFIPGLDFMEDLYVLIRIIHLKKPKIVFVPGMPVYHYILRENSYTNKLSEKYLRKGLCIVELVDDLLSNEKLYSKGLKEFKLYHRLLWLLNVDTAKFDVNSIFPEVNNFILKSSLSWKYKGLLYAERQKIHGLTEIFKKLKNKK